MKPWEANPQLTADRAVRVARVLVNVRDSLAEKLGPEQAVAPWGVGCLAYELSIAELERLSEISSWLRVQRSGLQFSFFVGADLIKFYRGDESRPGDRRLRIAGAELQNSPGQQALFPEEQGWFWFFALSTGEDGRVERVTLMQCRDDGSARYHWDVPWQENVIPMERPPVELPAAKLELIAELEDDISVEE